jgi:hypothetical protein
MEGFLALAASDLFLSELTAISRAPQDEEEATIKNFIDFLVKNGIPVNEVRFIDAESHIGGLRGLEAARQSMLLRHVKNPSSDIAPLIDEFLSSSSFKVESIPQDLLGQIKRDYAGVENGSREQIKELLIEGAKNPLYRNFILNLIGWSEASPAIYDFISHACSSSCRAPLSRQIKFISIDDNDSFSDDGGIIALNTRQSIKSLSFFSPTSAESNTGLISYGFETPEVVFHEGEHVALMNIASVAEKFSMLPHLSRLMSSLFTRDISIKSLQTDIGILKEIPENDFLLGFIGELVGYFGIDSAVMNPCMNPEKLVEIFPSAIKNLSKEKVACRMFTNPMEFWQIYGLLPLTYQGKTVLYINMHSDFALAAYGLRPVRFNHRGSIKESLSFPDDFMQYHENLAKDIVDPEVFKPNEEFYDLMLKILGKNEDYKSKYRYVSLLHIDQDAFEDALKIALRNITCLMRVME